MGRSVKTKTNQALIHLDPERIARRGDRPMDGAEMLDEFEFLLDAGTHPMLATQMLGVPYENLLSTATRHGRNELFTRVRVNAWNEHRHDRGNQYGRVA